VPIGYRSTVRLWVAILVAVVAFTGARLARMGAVIERESLEIVDEPFTPSQAAAPFVSLGYRELWADLLYVRLRGYYGGYYGTTANGVASLGEAIVTLDPKFERIYEFTANAMTLAPSGVDQSIFLRSIALLERGIAQFPLNWPMPMLAGQIYIQDLQTDDKQQRRAWDERGVLLVESAVRKPGAPQQVAGWAALIRTRLGQRDRAIKGLRELLLLTNDPKVQKRLLAQLATIEQADSAEIAAELSQMRTHFETTWKAERPAVRASMYVLIGPPLGAAFDLADLALGGREIIGEQLEEFERLEPADESDKPTP